MKLRIALNKSLRIGLIGALVVLIATVSVLLYTTIKNPEVIEKKEKVFSYKAQPSANYTVYFKPNMLYSKDSLGEDQFYITDFVDYIDTTLAYDFAGDRSTDYSGSRKVVARLEGKVGQDKEIKTIWKKDFVVVPEESFEVKGKENLTIKENLKLYLEPYQQFVLNFAEQTKINTNVQLTLFMDVNVTAQTTVESIKEKATPSLTIPMNTGYFSIAKGVTEETEKTIEDTVMVQLPINKNLVVTYSVVLGIAIIALLYFIFFASAKSVDRVYKEIKKIFKQHSSRLVALNSEISRTWKKYHKVYTIDDLVKIADEIERPMMYKYSPEMKEINQFYVFDDNSIYIFDLKETLEQKGTDQQMIIDVSKTLET